jgi:hypothetical protein
MAPAPANQHLDDRGQPVALWSYHQAVRGDDPLLRSIAMRALQIEAAEFRRTNILWGLCAGVVAITWTAVGLPPMLLIPAFTAMILLSQLGHRARVRQKVAPAIRLTLLSEICCPSCSYDLQGIPADLDRRTSCPECRAAWRIEPEMVAARQARERLAPVQRSSFDDTSDDRRARDGLQRVIAWFGWKRTFAAKDARGRMVEVVNPGPFAKRPPFWDTIPWPEHRRLWWRLYLVGWPLRLLMLSCTLPAMIFMGWSFLLRTGPAGFSYRPLSVAFALMQGVVFPLVVLGVVLNPLSRSGRSIVRIMLAARRCPACAKQLPELDDGVEAQCPACLACWAPPAPTP